MKAIVASLALRPTGLVRRPGRPLRRDPDRVDRPAIPLVSYQVQPATTWVDPSFAGELHFEGALDPDPLPQVASSASTDVIEAFDMG